MLIVDAADQLVFGEQVDIAERRRRRDAARKAQTRYVDAPAFLASDIQIQDHFPRRLTKSNFRQDRDPSPPHCEDPFRQFEPAACAIARWRVCFEDDFLQQFAR